jgi:hypothetical protein
MKNICLSFFVVVFTGLSSAQELKLGWEYVEIYIITTGLEQSETIRYEMKAISPVWFKNRLSQSDIDVTLKIYDILGREVATLVNERKPAEM